MNILNWLNRVKDNITDKTLEIDQTTYGLSVENPVYVDSEEAAYNLLAHLTTIDGKRISYYKTREINTVVNRKYMRALVGEYKLFDSTTIDCIGFFYICSHAKKQYDILPAGYMLSDKTNPEKYSGHLENESQAMGFSTVDDCIRLKKLKYQNTVFLKERENFLYQKIDALQLLYPDIDTEKEKQSKKFMWLLDRGIDCKIAYQYMHRAKIMQKKEFTITTKPANEYVKLFRYLIHNIDSIKLKHLDDKCIRYSMKTHPDGMSEDQNLIYLKLDEIEKNRQREEMLSQVHDWADIAIKWPDFDYEKDFANPLFEDIVTTYGFRTAETIFHFYEFYSELP